MNLQEILSVVSPTLLGIGAILAGARWLWHRFDKSQKESLAVLLQSMKTLSDTVIAHAEQDSVYFKNHGERLAWLEGRNGLPLGGERGIPTP